MPRKSKDLTNLYMKQYRKTKKYQEYHSSYMQKYREKHKERLSRESNARCHRLWTQNRDSELHVRRSLLRRAKKRAASKQLPFNLTLDDIRLPKRCPIFGTALKVNPKRYSGNSPSLDRIIPEKGYVKGNVVVISHRANELKRDASLEELTMLVRGLRRITQKC